MSLLGVGVQKLGSILQNFLFSVHLTRHLFFSTIFPTNEKPSYGGDDPQGLPYNTHRNTGQTNGGDKYQMTYRNLSSILSNQDPKNNNQLEDKNE